MNLKILMIGAIFLPTLLIFVIKNNFFYDKKNVEGDSKKSFRIAILTPATHPSLQQIENGFCKILNQSENAKYKISVFNANGDRVLLRAQAEEIINQNFDLIFTIAAAPSLISKELCVKKGKNIPIVFGAVADPVRLGLLKSTQNPDGFITGAIETPDYETQIKLLLRLKPEIENVLLIYNPTQGAGLEKDKNEVSLIFSKNNINLIPCEVFNLNEIQGKLAGLIKNVDLVFILKDNTVVSGIDGIIKQCNLNNVTLMATDLDSGVKGAALSFGIKEVEFGTYAALLAKKILEDKISPSKLPCISAYKNRLKINAKTMLLQGLSISENILELFKYVEIV